MTELNNDRMRHVLGISGGRDSAALAVYMREKYPEIDMQYFFTDTGKELPEVYEYLGKLEGFLGKEILRLNGQRDFDYWLKRNNHFLPSPRARWCTIEMKIKPFEAWVQSFIDQGETVHSYIAIRSDEPYRAGYDPKQRSIVPCLPFREDGIDKEGVVALLENVGLGLPDYYNWRSRSGCTFCFYQQKIEWVGLLERHPAAFWEAVSYEKTAREHDSPFTWSESESLEEIAKPERIAEIRKAHAKRLERVVTARKQNPLRPDDQNIDIDELYPDAKVCITCHK